MINAYVTLDEFKAYASVRGASVGADASDDTVITDIIETASRYLDNEARRRFWKNTTDEVRYYTPADDDTVYIDDLAGLPAKIELDYAYDRSYNTILATTDVDFEPGNALLEGWPYTWIELSPAATDYFPVCKRGVKITGKFGFPSVPPDIKAACLGIALNIYQSRSGQSSSGNVTVTAAGVVIRPQDVPEFARATIHKYQRLT
jgi:hypothetical protein